MLRKPAFLTFLLLLALHDAQGQMSTASYDLNGPVKKAVLREYKCNPDGSIIQTRDYYKDEIYHFSRNGFLTLYEEDNTRKWEETKKTEVFFLNDTLIVKEVNYANGTLSSTVEYSYNAQYQCTSEVTKTIEDGDTTIDENIHLYDPKGQRIGYNLYHNGVLDRRVELVLDKFGNWIRRNSYAGDKLTSYAIAAYDANHHKVKDEDYDGNGTLKGYTQYDYDKNGRRTQFIRFGPDKEPKEKRTYEYHPNGQVAAELTYDYGGEVAQDGTLASMFSQPGQKEPPSYYNMYYDDQGNTTKIETNNVGPVQTQTWEYTYDKYGSWLTKKWGRPGFAISIQVRTLEYYD